MDRCLSQADSRKRTALAMGFELAGSLWLGHFLPHKDTTDKKKAEILKVIFQCLSSWWWRGLQRGEVQRRMEKWTEYQLGWRQGTWALLKLLCIAYRLFRTRMKGLNSKVPGKWTIETAQAFLWRCWELKFDVDRILFFGVGKWPKLVRTFHSLSMLHGILTWSNLKRGIFDTMYK